MKRILFTALPVLAIAIGVFIYAGKEEQPTSDEINTAGSYAKYLKTKAEKKRNGAVKAKAPDMHALIQRELRTRDGAEGPEYGPNQVIEEYLKAKSASSGSTSSQARGAAAQPPLTFIERGPGNVGGRTRALLVDPDDTSGQTWYAGAASGGIWKTTNGGDSWTFISDDIPNLGTNTLAMSAANSSVIYAGTGEHFTSDIDGAGMFKSTDKGATWTQIADPSTYPDFKNVSRIVVDPADENVVIATTRNTVWTTVGLEAAIYKTTDGGTSWTQLRSSTAERYDDIAYDPTDFNTLYVAVQNEGVIKSTDGGTSWADASSGLFPGGRVEIAISPVNANRLWASVQGGLSGNGSDLYVTSDGAATWQLALNSGGNNEDFLGGQGWYDNYATTHPFDEDVVYVGGVNNWKFTFEGSSITTETIEVIDNGSEAFMGRVSFSAPYDGGRLDIGSGVSLASLLSVEVRFGQGTQMAHRFTVDMQGSGVASADYTYEDYVEIPFQVWDTDNDVQLMVSFRDQQEDGAWNLLEQNTTAGNEANHSREYVYIHSTPYATSADGGIAQAGGIETDQQYFFWPVLQAGETFDPNSLPVSSLAIATTSVSGVSKITTNISDAYGDFAGLNDFSNQGTRDEGIHPDQHNSIITDVDEANGTFRLMITNDGSIYETVSSTDPGATEGDFTYVGHGYNTTQFYGADKAPGQDRYIGGTQDNGTWYHPSGTTGSASADAVFGIGGDGFEALWHSGDPNKMIGGSQFNNFQKTEDGGQTWVSATTGFADNGPFRTRLQHHKSTPDQLYTVGTSGVWKTSNFADEWSASTMNSSSLYSFSNSSDVEVSYADPDVVWAGAHLTATSRLFVSTDRGETFDPVENYTGMEMGAVSGIGTHPTDNQTAYAVFSFAGYPKVLRTQDLGQTWVDISGFDGTGDRGFPDVAVSCIFVFPNDPNKIWAGSEIGIIESLDAGASWGLLDSNFPAVNVHDIKLTDNQLVLATYGRGMWSVEIPDITVAPIVQNAYASPTGEINLDITYLTAFDSTEVYIDDVLITTISSNSVETISEVIAGSGITGNIRIQLIGYTGGVSHPNVEIDAFILPVTAVANSYSTDFEDAEADFFNTDFTFSKELFFDDIAVHTPHPYANAASYIIYLQTPVTIAAADANFEYSDVAILEPGEDGSEYPNSDFYDYVVVEASSDGLNWIPLEDGYDASLHQDWLDTYNQGTIPTDDLFRPHTIDLLDHFVEGDVILVRFRMFADGGTTAYGWAFDDLYIQEEKPLGLADEVATQLDVYPNPIASKASIIIENGSQGSIDIYNTNGQLVDQLHVESGQSLVEWTPKNLSTGLYIMKYQTGDKLISKKLLLK